MTRQRSPSTRDGKALTHLSHNSALDDDIDLDVVESSALPSDGLLPHVSPAAAHPPKARILLGVTLLTPNTTRFSYTAHSRILETYPFLLEVFYLSLHYLFFRGLSAATQHVLKQTPIWEVAESHALAVFDAQYISWTRHLLLVPEIGLQHYLTNHVPILVDLMNFFCDVQMPLVVGFLAWLYASSTPTVYASVRRSLAFLTFLCFWGFALYPCTPPRLLPLEYYFFYNNANQAAWANGDLVALNAIPSLPFGYALVVGATLVYHSGLFRKLDKTEARKSRAVNLACVLGGVAWPFVVLFAQVTTGRDFWLGAWIAAGLVVVAAVCNRLLLVLLPYEDMLFWGCKINKPAKVSKEDVVLRGEDIERMA